jgi:hypothetical protein
MFAMRDGTQSTIDSGSGAVLEPSRASAPGLAGPAAPPEARRLAPYPARGLPDIRFRSERRRLGSIFLCHAPERLNDIIARRSASVSRSELREFHQLTVLHFRAPMCNMGESRSSVTKPEH